MEAIDALLESLPEAARDLKLNLRSVLGESSLTAAQAWGTAVACAIACNDAELQAAVVAVARSRVEPGVIDDAVAAASLMAMNNVFYRFRHMMGEGPYAAIPVRLRMNRLARYAAARIDLELFCLAVSAIHHCEACVRAHEKVVREGGLGEQQVHDAVRIAAVLHGTAVARRARSL